MTLSLEDCSLARRFPYFFDFVDDHVSGVRTVEPHGVFSETAVFLQWSLRASVK